MSCNFVFNEKCLQINAQFTHNRNHKCGFIFPFLKGYNSVAAQAYLQRLQNLKKIRMPDINLNQWRRHSLRQHFANCEGLLNRPHSISLRVCRLGTYGPHTMYEFGSHAEFEFVSCTGKCMRFSYCLSNAMLMRF